MNIKNSIINCKTGCSLFKNDFKINFYVVKINIISFCSLLCIQIVYDLNYKMLFIYKNQNKASFFFLCTIVALSSLNIYFNPFLFVSVYKDAPLTNLLNELLFTFLNEQFIFILFCFLQLLSALIFNKIIHQFNFKVDNNYVPALIFICLMASFNEYVYYTSLLYIIPILLITIKVLTEPNEVNNFIPKSSALGFLNGLSIFLFAPSVILVPFFLIAALLNKRLTLVALGTYLTAFVLPFLFYIFFINESEFSFDFLGYQLSFPNFGNQNVKSIQFAFACVLSFVAFLFTKREINKSLRKIYRPLTLLLTFLIVSIPFFTIKSEMDVLTLLLVPLAIYLSTYLLNSRKSWLAELLFFLLFISIFVFQYMVY